MNPAQPCACAVPFSEQVERMVELRQVLDGAASMLRVYAMCRLRRDLDREPVDQPVREYVERWIAQGR